MIDAHTLTTYCTTTINALAAGSTDRRGPLPFGGAHTVAERTLAAIGAILPEEGTDAHTVLHDFSYALAWGAADPHHPHTIAHLQCPPHLVAIAADLAVNAMNASLDSWDQAPSATVIEQQLCATISTLVYPSGNEADAIITSGGTESNLIALLVAREKLGPGVQVFTGSSSHHSIYRSCWQLGLRPPILLPTPAGTLDPAQVAEHLAAHDGPTMLVATAGTTDEGHIDPLNALADIAEQQHALFHVDAAYGGMLLVSDTLRHQLQGIERAHTVTLDFHKMSFQPIAASSLVTRDKTLFQPLSVQADYLNAEDDSSAGIPSVLDRSIRTSRRLDALKVAATWKTLGRKQLAAHVEHCVQHAELLAHKLDATGRYERPRQQIGISTVLFRSKEFPSATASAAVRRQLLLSGQAVTGRATLDDGTPNTVWLKATILNPQITAADLDALITKIDEAVTAACSAEQ